MSVAVISPQSLQERVSSGEPVQLIDVRTPAEYREVHVGFANSVPLDQMDCARITRERGNSNAPLYVICRSGNRARQACEKLMAAGCTQVVNVEGGTTAWEQAGLPVVRGQKMMSLERQVRIAAGALVLTGALLSFIHPYWAGLAAFVGAGLMFAGITDTCGMGMVLARMPWNQVALSPSSPATCATDAGPAGKSCCG